MLRRTEVSQQMSQLGHSLHSRLLPTRFFVRCAPNSDRSIAGVANDATGQRTKSLRDSPLKREACCARG
jgi:hypothetical protein